ncbi:MAG: PspA/IM30 family protein [Myxococcota bacterium]
MGILSRLSKALEANLNALVEKAEDPAKVLEQAILDMKAGREEARTAIVDAKTELKLAEKRRDTARKEAGDLEQKAMKALEIGDEKLARKLLELKLAADQKADLEGTTAASHAETVGQLENADRELEMRLREMPAKKAQLLARQATAQARGAKVGGASKAQNAVAGALEAFDRMEERITRAEVDAEVRGEMAPQFMDLRALEAAKADDALKELKAKMAARIGSGQPEPKATPTAAASDPVEDSLAALKAKLAKA